MIPPAAPEPPRAVPQEAVQPVLPPPQPETLDIVLTAFSGLGYALSARALLLLSIVGAFTLAIMAIMGGHISALVALGLYCAMVVIPMCLLEFRRREA